MLKQPIHITSFGSISPLGSTADEVWSNYLKPETLIDSANLIVANLKSKEDGLIEDLSYENRKYRSLDKTVLFAIFSGRQALKNSGWTTDSEIGINMGSSRGATELFERFHSDFLHQKKLNTLTSPNTTLGNISTWLANDLQVNGPVISHSITCSTALHSILNGIAWLNADMSTKFMVGGSESANTEFTVSQMQVLNIYSKVKNEYPCKSLAFNKTQNTMVLGEGSAVFCLEKNAKKSVAKIIGYGFATELVDHNASISTNADCFQDSMQMATKGFNKNEIDVIVMHAPGTIKGDLSELNAIKKVFGTNLPAITSNKWKIGHTLGASGALSLEFAILMLQHQQLIESPFYENKKKPKQLKKILINAVGFGGNAVSILIEK